MSLPSLLLLGGVDLVNAGVRLEAALCEGGIIDGELGTAGCGQIMLLRVLVAGFCTGVAACRGLELNE